MFVPQHHLLLPMLSPVPVRTQTASQPALGSSLSSHGEGAMLSSAHTAPGAALAPGPSCQEQTQVGAAQCPHRLWGHPSPAKQPWAGSLQVTKSSMLQHSRTRVRGRGDKHSFSTEPQQCHTQAKALTQVVTFTQLESGTGSTPQAQSWLWNGTQTLLLQPKAARSSQICCPNSRAQTPPPSWCALLMGHHSPGLVLGTNQQQTQTDWHHQSITL